MSVSNLSALVGVMTKAADRASKSLLRDFGEVEHLQISRKGPADFVSEADRRAEEILYENLSQSRPGFSFYGEENGERAALVTDGSQRAGRFIVDPLDGTTNFLHGLPHWCISIAAEIDGQIVAGVVYDPVKDELFAAEKGKGAWMGSKKLRASRRDSMADCLFAVGLPFKGHGDVRSALRQSAVVTSQSSGLRRFGSAALDLAYTAAGRYDGFWEAGLNAYDVAAGALIASEAGCIVTDYAGSAEFIKNRQILATGPMIYEKLRAEINQAVQQ